MRVINETYAVFFDTNTIKGKYWLDYSVKKGVISIGQETMIPVELYIPEVVQKEWTRYYSRYVKEQFDKITEAASKLAEMNFNDVAPHVFDEKITHDTAEKLLASLGFTIIPTPHENINYPAILDLAVKKQPPFEPLDGTDKGLKDAIIAETIKQYSIEHPEQKIVFVGRDGLMTEYLKSVISAKTEMLVYESLEEFSEELKLQNNNLSKELAKGASDAFFVQDVKSTFYYLLNIKDLLIGKYRSKLVDAESARKHLRLVKTTPRSLPYSTVAGGKWNLDINKVYVSDPSFIEKNAQNLFWSVTLDFVQNYNVEVVTSIADAPASKYVDKHTVVYELTWTAELSADGDLIHPSIKDIVEVTEIQSISDTSPTTALSRLLDIQYLVNPTTALTQNSLTETLDKLSGATKVLPDMSWIEKSLGSQKIADTLAGIAKTNMVEWNTIPIKDRSKRILEDKKDNDLN